MRIFAYSFIVLGICLSAFLLYYQYIAETNDVHEIQLQINPDFSEREAKRYNAFVASYLAGQEGINAESAVAIGDNATEILRTALREATQIYDPQSGYVFWMHVAHGFLFIWNPETFRFEGLLDVQFITDIGGSRRDNEFYINQVASLWQVIQLIRNNGLQIYIEDGSIFSIWSEPNDKNTAYAYSIFDRIIRTRRDSDVLMGLFRECVTPIRDNLLDNANTDVIKLFYVEPEIGILYSADILGSRYEMVWIDTSNDGCELAETVNGFSIVTAD